MAWAVATASAIRERRHGPHRTTRGSSGSRPEGSAAVGARDESGRRSGAKKGQAPRLKVSPTLPPRGLEGPPGASHAYSGGALGQGWRRVVIRYSARSLSQAIAPCYTRRPPSCGETVSMTCLTCPSRAALGVELATAVTALCIWCRFAALRTAFGLRSVVPCRRHFRAAAPLPPTRTGATCGAGRCGAARSRGLCPAESRLSVMRMSRGASRSGPTGDSRSSQHWPTMRSPSPDTPHREGAPQALGGRRIARKRRHSWRSKTWVPHDVTRGRCRGRIPWLLVEGGDPETLAAGGPCGRSSSTCPARG